MKKINLRVKISGIYIVMLLICIIMINLNYSFLYNKVIIINDKDEVVKKINMSIPIKVEISNERWGEYFFEDETSIQQIWNSINEITKDSSVDDNYDSEVSDIKINGTIYYLNGTKDNFEISNKLSLNNNTYNDKYKIPLINSLKNKLLGYLYSTSNIVKIINSNNEIIIIDRNKNIKELDKSHKENIENTINDSLKLENNKEIINLLKSKTEALYHIKIYLDNDKDNLSKVKCSNLVNIDVYENDFFVVQYMGDENGRHIYFRGKLNDVCKKIFINEL
ncbi:DUF3919 family protein [Clostridium butyricum]